MNIKKLSVFTVLFLLPALYICAADIIAEVPVQPAEAEESASGAMKAYDRQFYSNFITAAYYENKGNNKEAFDIYEKLYKIVPGDRAVLSSLAALSIEIQNKEAMEKYIPAYYSAMPGNPLAMAMQAGLLWSRGELQGAAELYKSALEKAPENPEIITRYITLLSALDADEAIKYLTLLSKQYPGMGPIISVNIADLYLKQGDKKAAVKYLEDYIKGNPYSSEPYVVLAGIYEASGQPEKALAAYLGMEKHGLASADILVKIGAYYTLADKRAQALSYFKRAKALDNAQPAAAQFLVLDAQSRGDYEAAAAFLQDSSAYDKEPSFHIRASYFLSRAGKRGESAEILQEAYKMFPDDKEIAFYYALSLIDLKEYKQAEKILSSALESTPDNESILFHYAYTLERQKKYKKMEKQLKKILELNPKNSDALNYYGYYLIDKTRRLEEGGEYIKAAIAITPDDPAFIDSLAWYQYKKGDYEEAYKLLGSIPSDKLTALNDTEIYLHLAQTAQQLELWQESADYYDLVLQAEPENKTALKNLKKVSKKIKS